MQTLEKFFLRLLVTGLVAIVFAELILPVAEVPTAIVVAAHFCFWFSIVAIPISIVILLGNRVLMKLNRWRFREWKAPQPGQSDQQPR